MNKKVFIIVLNYNNYHDTIECLGSINDTICAEGVNIVVVDNASTNDSVEQLKKRQYHNVTIIENSVNLGYAGGNNVAIKYAMNKGADYIVILNNDTIVCEDFITICIDELERDNRIAFVGPVILDYKTGLIQSAGANIDFNKGEILLLNRGKSVNDAMSSTECDYIGGACMVFSRGTVEKIGMIPEDYFLFYEETEWCCIAQRNGLKNVCVPAAKVVHKGSVSIKQIPGLHNYLMERNRVVFMKRNRKSWIQYIGFLFYLFAKTIYRMVFEDIASAKDFKAYMDGILGKVDKKKCPFIINDKG